MNKTSFNVSAIIEAYLVRRGQYLTKKSFIYTFLQIVLNFKIVKQEIYSRII